MDTNTSNNSSSNASSNNLSVTDSVNQYLDNMAESLRNEFSTFNQIHRHIDTKPNFSFLSPTSDLSSLFNKSGVNQSNDSHLSEPSYLSQTSLFQSTTFTTHTPPANRYSGEDEYSDVIRRSVDTDMKLHAIIKKRQQEQEKREMSRVVKDELTRTQEERFKQFENKFLNRSISPTNIVNTETLNDNKEEDIGPSESEIPAIVTSPFKNIPRKPDFEDPDVVLVEKPLKRMTILDMPLPDVQRAVDRNVEKTVQRSFVSQPTFTVPTSQMINLTSHQTESIRTLGWVLRFIDEVYNNRHQCFLNEISSHDGTVETFSSFVFNFISKKFGLDSLVKQAAFELLESVKFHRASNKQVELFGLFLTPYYSAMDLMFFLHSRSLALLECVSGEKIPHLNKKRKKKIGINPQYLPGIRITYLTKRILSDQPKALVDNCLKELGKLLKKKTDETKEQKRLFTASDQLFRQGRFELYEYLILLLVQYKAFREAKNANGELYFYTIRPEEVSLHHRRRDPKLHMYIVLRETQFHRTLLNEALRKKRESLLGQHHQYEIPAESEHRSREDIPSAEDLLSELSTTIASIDQADADSSDESSY